MEFVRDEALWEELLANNGYDLVGRLDSGSFSDVFTARCRTTGATLAVKRIVARHSIADDPRVAAEAGCLARLSARGACVIRLHEMILLKRLAFLVLELAPLGDLENYSSRHWPLSERLVVNCTRQITSALIYCHRMHIAHRDVNPANVLLVSAHSVRLGDFGLSVLCKDPDTGKIVLCDDYLGRESYLAPEVLAQSPYCALKADMWSLGCLGFFLLTGKHPVPARGPQPSPLTNEVSSSSSGASDSSTRCCQWEWNASAATIGSGPLDGAETKVCQRKRKSVCESENSSSAMTGSDVSDNATTVSLDHMCEQNHSADEECAVCSVNDQRDKRQADFVRSRTAPKLRLPSPPSHRNKRYRGNSCESEGSCRSESDLEELATSTPMSISSFDSESNSPSPFHPSSFFYSASADCPFHSPAVDRFTWMTEAEIFKETSAVESALAQLLSKLCVTDPRERINSDDCLEFWKQSVGKTTNRS